MADPSKTHDQQAPPKRYISPMVAAYMKDIDVTLLRENLKLTVTERFEKFEKFYEYAMELREAGQRARAKKP